MESLHSSLMTLRQQTNDLNTMSKEVTRKIKQLTLDLTIKVKTSNEDNREVHLMNLIDCLTRQVKARRSSLSVIAAIVDQFESTARDQK